MRILDRLWYGNVCPCERQFTREGAYGKQVRRIADCEEQLRSQLSEGDWATLQELVDAQLTASGLAECDSFIRGVRFGVLLMLDVFQPTGDSGLEPV